MVVEAAGGSWEQHTGTRFEAGTGSLARELLERREQMVFNQTASLVDWRLPPFIKDQDEHVFCLPRSVVETSDWIFWAQKRIPFLPREVQLLASFADVASVAIHRATLFDQTRQQLNHIHSLRRIDLTILENKDVQATMQVIVEIARAHLPVDAAGVYLQATQPGELWLTAAEGFDPPLEPGAALPAARLHSPCPCKQQHGVTVHARGSHPRFWAARGLEERGFSSYVALPVHLDDSQPGLLELFSHGPLYLKSGDADFLQALRSQASIALENARLLHNLSESNRRLLRAYDSTIEGWSSTLALRDEETQEHTLRVTRLSLLLADKLGVLEEERKYLRWGALLHDIGKMGIPDSILLKPGPLTDEERLIMEKHPIYAYECLRKIEFLDQALAIPFCHHEHWDGSGYPQGLVGKSIPLPARIFAVADVWDALRTGRPYRPAWQDDKALAYIQSESGTHFDPQIVQAFLELLEDGQLDGL
jgi:putative nucleotidyltransferase with HDIG domain